VLRRILLVAAMVAASTALAVPVAGAGPAVTQCPPEGGVKVLAADSPATISITDTRTNTAVDVVVTITGTTFTIAAPSGATYTLDTGSWCVKSSLKSTSPSPGTGLTGTSPSTNRKGVTQSIGYVTIYGVTSATPSTTCFDQTASSVFGEQDLLLTGPVGQAANAYTTNSRDGSCSGGQFTTPILRYTVVSPSSDPPDFACAAFNANFFGVLNDVWDSPPSTDLWVCIS
jgi:hypothetical protein